MRPSAASTWNGASRHAVAARRWASSTGGTPSRNASAFVDPRPRPGPADRPRRRHVRPCASARSPPPAGAARRGRPDRRVLLAQQRDRPWRTTAAVRRRAAASRCRARPTARPARPRAPGPAAPRSAPRAEERTAGPGVDAPRPPSRRRTGPPPPGPGRPAPRPGSPCASPRTPPARRRRPRYAANASRRVLEQIPVAPTCRRRAPSSAAGRAASAGRSANRLITSSAAAAFSARTRDPAVQARSPRCAGPATSVEVEHVRLATAAASARPPGQRLRTGSYQTCGRRHGHQLALGVAQRGQPAAEHAAGVQADGVVDPLRRRHRRVAVQRPSPGRGSRRPTGSAPAARTRRSPRSCRRTARTSAPGPTPGRGSAPSARRGRPPAGRRRARSGDQPVARIVAPRPRNSSGSARQLRQRLGEPVADRDLAAAQRPDQLVPRGCRDTQSASPAATMPITSRSTPGVSGPRSTRSPTNTAGPAVGVGASTGRPRSSRSIA